ncbi:hypothetical protein EDB89DRAFT_1915158 [Lactarius sanguifluus]|nr:hypothetical protein EDB89DRAFT_1915158 [Lactarius sanguifluus]
MDKTVRDQALYNLRKGEGITQDIKAKDYKASQATTEGSFQAQPESKTLIRLANGTRPSTSINHVQAQAHLDSHSGSAQAQAHLGSSGPFEAGHAVTCWGHMTADIGNLFPRLLVALWQMRAIKTWKAFEHCGGCVHFALPFFFWLQDQSQLVEVETSYNW